MKASTRSVALIAGSVMLLVSELAWSEMGNSHPSHPAANENSKALQLDLSIDVLHVLTPDQLRIALGTGAASADDPMAQMESVEVSAQRQEEDTLQSRIPFGLASIVWASEHPAQFWRLFAPVMSG